MKMDSTQFSKEAFLRGFIRRLKSQAATAAQKTPRVSAKGTKGTIDKVPGGFAESVGATNPQKAWQGYREMANRGGGAESLLLYPAQLAAEKMLGQQRVRNALWKYVSGPALAADTAVGNVLAKTPVVGKRLFRVKETVPWGGSMHREIERSSALGPLTKARDIAEPIIVGVGLEKGMKHLTKSTSPSNESSTQDKKLREKVASVMLNLHKKNREHEKRAHAERIFWKQVERGIEQPPESYSELQSKLASLVTEDLKVLERAVELAGGQMKLGELADVSKESQGLSASEKFQADLLD